MTNATRPARPAAAPVAPTAHPETCPQAWAPQAPCTCAPAPAPAPAVSRDTVAPAAPARARKPKPAATLTPADARALLASLPDAPGLCGCGCGLAVAREFAPGHDAKLKGGLTRLVASPSVPRALRADALERILARGWARFVKPGSADDLGCLPTVDPTDRRRRVDVCHADIVSTLCTDADGVSHSHGECPHIRGTWTRHPVADTSQTGWLCSGCIEVATPAERVSRQVLQTWVLADPTDTAENTPADLDAWYARQTVPAASLPAGPHGRHIATVALLALAIDTPDPAAILATSPV